MGHPYPRCHPRGYDDALVSVEVPDAISTPPNILHDMLTVQGSTRSSASAVLPEVPPRDDAPVPARGETDHGMTAKRPDGERMDRQDATQGVPASDGGRHRRRTRSSVGATPLSKSRTPRRRARPQVLLSDPPEDDAATVARVPDGSGLDPVVVRPPAGLEAYRSTASSDRARPLPVADLTGSLRQILREVSPDAAGLLFDSINGLRDCEERVRLGDEKDTREALSTEASFINMRGKLALRVIELVQGKHVSMNVNIANQESVPDWEAMPASVREEVEKEIQRIAMEATKA